MSARPDSKLLRTARSDPAAFEMLYRRHVRRLMSYAARRCTCAEDVADVVATTFVVVLESADQYDEQRGEVLPWLLGIARHVAADLARSAQREREALAFVAGWRSLDQEEILQLEERIDAARNGPAIEAALELLPVRDREALWLVGYDGLSQKQAAQVLGMSAPAFRMRLMRARRLLRSAIGRSTEERTTPTTTHSVSEEAPT